MPGGYIPVGGFTNSLRRCPRCKLELEGNPTPCPRCGLDLESVRRARFKRLFAIAIPLDLAVIAAIVWLVLAGKV